MTRSRDWALVAALAMVLAVTGRVWPDGRKDTAAPKGTQQVKVYALGYLATRAGDPAIGTWLAKTIPQVIEPGSWSSGGGAGTLCYYSQGKILVVSHEAGVQEKVRAFLDNLKAELPRETKAAAKDKSSSAKPVIIPARLSSPDQDPALPTMDPAFVPQVVNEPARHYGHLLLEGVSFKENAFKLKKFSIMYRGEGLIDDTLAKLIKSLNKQSPTPPRSNSNPAVPVPTVPETKPEAKPVEDDSEPEPTAAVSKFRTIYHSKHTMYVPVKIEPDVRPKLSEVRLYVKQPGGKWQLHQTISPRETYFTYDAPNDGAFLLNVQTVSKRGELVPPNINKVQPSMKVVVDSQPPTIALKRAKGADGKPRILCEIEDANPDPSSIKIQYRDHGGIEQELDADPTRPGLFRVPNANLSKQTVKVSASDRCGNTVTREAMLSSLENDRDVAENVPAPKKARRPAPTSKATKSTFVQSRYAPAPRLAAPERPTVQVILPEEARHYAHLVVEGLNYSEKGVDLKKLSVVYRGDGIIDSNVAKVIKAMQGYAPRWSMQGCGTSATRTKLLIPVETSSPAPLPTIPMEPD